MQIAKNRDYKKWLIWGLRLLAIILLAVFVYWVFWGSVEPPKTENQENVVIEPKPDEVLSNIMFFGNTYWGRYINDWSMASELKHAYPFSRLNEFDRESYDAWISGLECPTKSGVRMTSIEEDSTLTFNCSPEYLPEAAKWFTAFTLANNHTDNQGIDGFEETKQHLDENQIQYFGHYDPRSTGDNCEVIALPVTVSMDDQSSMKGNLPVAMCGYHGVFRIPGAEAVAEIDNYKDLMPVFALPHMGAEYKTSADELKQNLYRSLIDEGADVVLGDHPHFIQNSESYKGHLIVYSMGNFIFDQQDSMEVTRSAGINVVMKSASDNDKDNLKKWLALGATCKQFKDDCTQQALDQKLTKINFDFQFGVVGTNNANKIVKPATEEQQASILQRLNWTTTVRGLQSPYSGL